MEILLFTDGVGKLITLNEQYNISSGDLVIINSNAKHCEVSKKLSFYAIGINDLSIFNKEEYGNKIIYLKNTNNYQKLILNIFELIYTQLENKSNNTTDIINIILCFMFISSHLFYFLSYYTINKIKIIKICRIFLYSTLIFQK